MKSFTNLLLGSLTFLAVASCGDKKDDVKPSTDPKEYNVEYKISSTNVTESDFVVYTNETGGDTQLSNVKLPASFKFKRTMKLGDDALIGASLDGGTATSDITTTILLDGKQVDTKTARGENANAVSVYIIGQ